jgi:aryl carrier-like protein
MTRADLAREIARIAGVSHEDVPGTLGLSSVDVMRIVNTLRVRGVPVTYRDLAEEQTLDAWWARISHLLAANPHLAA